RSPFSILFSEVKIGVWRSETAFHMWWRWTLTKEPRSDMPDRAAQTIRHTFAIRLEHSVSVDRQIRPIAVSEITSHPLLYWPL
ncbi:hypothetical protein, partial [Pseudoduganella violaceinigra]|uniref:hypothetical protein n=1 Tax=Pseudoduganella violaceinigra TaxID=246602 RepID=UPI001B7FE51E